MIKDSKLIGTKIAAPFGWKKFKVGELFEVQSTNAVKYDDLISNGKYPYVVRSANNNGIREYMSGDSAMLNKGGCITLGIDTASYFYQDCDKFFAGNKVKALYLLDHELSETIALYLVECLSRYVAGYGYAGGKPFKISDFLNEFLILPITATNKPDFDWMSAYMKVVKQDYLEQKELANQREIKDYLTAGKVDSMDVTDADRQFLRDFEKLPRRKFKVGELFDKLSSKFFGSDNKFEHVYRTCTDDHNVPILYAKYNDNGIMYWAKQGDFETHSNCIGVIYNGAVSAGRVFAQKSPTGVLAESYLLSFKYCDVNFNVNLYLSAALQKVLFSKYSREYLATWNKVQFDEFELPVIASSQVDVQSIEKYMQIQVKLTIAKRKSYLDHELELMKQVC